MSLTTRAARWAVAILLVLVPATAAAADPLSLVDETEPVGPGITLRHHQYLTAAGWTDAQILRVDLSRPAVSTDLLTAGPAVNDRGPVSAMVADRGAVAGVNGDFFDIDGAGGPLGTAVQGGELLKGQAFGKLPLHAGVTKDGIGRLVDTALAATATLNGAPHAVQTFNTPSASVPADALVAFTPRWGAYDRSRGVQGVPAAQLVEAVVAGGEVVSVQPGVGTQPVPADGFTLVGRGAAAEVLRALAPGDIATFSYALRDAAARQLRFAIGGNHELVRDGQPLPIGDPSLAPRTAVGFSEDGRTMWLVTLDGRQQQVVGNTLTQVGEILAGLGAHTGLNLDGGGSTTMLARALGDPAATVRNVPSDGAERNDPNGVGVFVAPGSGTLDDLVITPKAPRVFPGLHRTLTAKGVDETQTPVAVARGDVAWSTARGTVGGGVLRAPRRATGTLEVHAERGAAAADTRVRVLGPLDRLELSTRRLALRDTATPAVLRVTGRDAQGYTAPVELADLDLEYDRSVLRITPAPGGLSVRPQAGGATVVRLRSGDATAALPVTVGVRTQVVYAFDAADESTRWTPNGTVPAEQRLSVEQGKLRLDHSARRNQGIATADPAGIPLPGQPLTVRLKLTSSNAQQFGSLYWKEADGRSRNQLVGPLRVGAQSVEWTLPSDVKFPIAFTQFQTIETDAAKQAPGSVVFDALEVDTAPDVQAPAEPAPREDPIVSADGRLPEAGWRFATLSDVQFTAADPELAKVAVAALERIRRDDPDLVVLNGDITDTGTPADVELARRVLEQGGCDLVPAGAQPDPGPGEVPCYYVPGNHESYGAGSSQGDLAPWKAQFGQPFRTFDHKGTRFVLLDSSRGTLRGSAFEQLPMLRQALESAKDDPAVDHVLVFAHHPVEDPLETAASRLTDRLEVQLVQRLLTAFVDASGKGAAMTGSHAQVVDVRRVEGVPYTVLPSSGKRPYGTPDRGGFTGYLRWNVDPQKAADERWLAADVRAFAQSVTVDAPATLARGATAQLAGSVVQPDGVAQDGTRVVPLRYPMSVRWGGSRSLQVGGTLAEAKAAGKVALLRPRTRRLIGVTPGEVTVTVTNESMRDGSAEPITGSATVTVTRLAGEPPATDPGTTDPGPTAPGTTDPGPTAPGAADPGQAAPAPGAPAPAPAPATTPGPGGAVLGDAGRGSTRRPRTTCRLVDRRRAVRCVVRGTARQTLRTTVRAAGRKRAVTRRGTARITVRLPRRVRAGGTVRVRLTVNGRATTKRLS